MFSYTGSPEVKISQKVLGGGLLFLTHTVDIDYMMRSFNIIQFHSSSDNDSK